MVRHWSRSIRVAETVLPSPSKVLRVSELTRYLKYLVEQDDLLAAISVRGEISSFSKSPNGHIYFTLKDATSQVSCVLFRREAMQQMTEIQELRQGVAAVVHGFLTVYEPRGSFQVYVERVLRAGDGPLFQRFEKLKAQLEQEGLFASDRKRALPEFPRMVALITPPDSQAYHDVLPRLR